MSVPLRLLWPAARAGQVVEPDDAEPVLADLYAYPGGDSPWVRANMVSTLDGAASGVDGRSGSINTAADVRVFVLLRALSDVVLVGAGTVRAEGYGLPRARPALAARRRSAGQDVAPLLAIVTRSGRVPTDQGLFGGERPTLVVTCRAAGDETLARLWDLAGDDHVIVAGKEDVDVPAALEVLGQRGFRRVLCEGGPSLLGAVAAAGCLDELCLTWSPTLVGGDGPRVVHGPLLAAPMTLAHLLHADDTLLGRWLRTP